MSAEQLDVREWFTTLIHEFINVRGQPQLRRQLFMYIKAAREKFDVTKEVVHGWFREIVRSVERALAPVFEAEFRQQYPLLFI